MLLIRVGCVRCLSGENIDRSSSSSHVQHDRSPVRFSALIQRRG